MSDTGDDSDTDDDYSVLDIWKDWAMGKNIVERPVVAAASSECAASSSSSSSSASSEIFLFSVPSPLPFASSSASSAPLTALSSQDAAGA